MALTSWNEEDCLENKFARDRECGTPLIPVFLSEPNSALCFLMKMPSSTRCGVFLALSKGDV